MNVSRETRRSPLAPPVISVSRETSLQRRPPTVSRETGVSTPGPLARAVLAPIRLYRRFLSPAMAPRCRYHPTCSTYAEEAIRELGAVRGTILALWRVLRCNPFAKGGLDPLSARSLFRETGPQGPGETA